MKAENKDSKIEQYAKACRAKFWYSSERQQDAVECRQMYNNDDIALQYSHLYTEARKELSDGSIINLKSPNQMKRTPIVRSKIRRMLADVKPIALEIYRTDAELHDEKIDAKLDDIFTRERTRIENRKRALDIKRQALAMQMQLVQQQSQQQDENGQPVQLSPEQQSQIQSIMTILADAEQFLNGRITHEQAELEQVNSYFDNNFKSESEKTMYKAMSYAIQTKHLDRLKVKGYEEGLVTDQEIYKVHWDGMSDDPDIELILPEYFSYPYNTDCEFIHELPYCQYTRMMAAESVIDKYSRHLDEQEIQRILGKSSNHNTEFDTVYVDINGYPMSGSGVEHHYRSHESEFEFEVSELYFKMEEKLYIVYKPEKGIRGEVPRIVDEATYKKEKAKGKHCEKRYMMKLYEAVFVNSHLLYAKECDTQKRDEYDFGSVRLPFIGYCRNKVNPTYSIMRETKSLQETYDICEWKKLFFVINAQANVTVMDMTQKPASLDLSQWEYFASIGRLLIDPSQGKGRGGQFNQWQEIQRGVSNSVEQLTRIQSYTLQMIGMITGVSDAMEAQIAHQQLATNTLEKITQSYLSTEYYAAKHEFLWNEVMTEYANYCKLSYANGKRATYVIGKKGQELLNIEKESLYGQFKVQLKSTAKAAAIVRSLRQMILPKMQQGTLSSSAFVSMMKTDDAVEMKEILEQAERLEREQQQMMIQRQQEGEKELSAQQHQQEMEIANLTNEVKLKIKQMEEATKQQALQLEMEIKQEELRMKQAEAAMKQEMSVAEEATKDRMNARTNEIKKYGIDQDAITEREYLSVQAKESESYIKLQALEMELKRMEINGSFANDKVDTRSMRDKNRIKD